jgi:hypothetical protein
MSQEEPAWRAELVEDLSKYDAYASQWLPLVEPHIQAAEERGRREALCAIGAEIEVLRDAVPQMSAREAWKRGYEGALAYMSATIGSITPEQP